MINGWEIIGLWDREERAYHPRAPVFEPPIQEKVKIEEERLIADREKEKRSISNQDEYPAMHDTANYPYQNFRQRK